MMHGQPIIKMLRYVHVIWDNFQNIICTAFDFISSSYLNEKELDRKMRKDILRS